MNIVEMFAKMNSGEIKAHSELGTRDESKQTRNFGTRIQKLKTVTGLNARILAMKDVVIPFNPFTVEEDEVYNSKNTFRPILLVTDTLTGIWNYCKQNPEVAEKWNARTGCNMLDENVTLRNIYDAFKACGFIVPRIMTYHTVSVNFGGIQGFPEFRVKYTVDSSELNDENSYDYGPNAPIWHQAAIFFNGLLKPEADSVKKELEAKGVNKDTISAERRAVYSRAPVGFVGPTNLVPFFYFPFNSELRKFDENDNKAIEESLRFYSYTDKWTIPLREATENPMYDTDMNFFDFHIKTPSAKETKPNGNVYTDDDSMEIYTAMQITNTDGRIALHGGKTVINGTPTPNEEVYESFFKAASAYFSRSQEESGKEGGETFEKIMAASNRFRPITQALDNFLPACNEVFVNTFANSKYFTEEYKKQHAMFFTAMNRENAMALADYDEDELEEAAEQNKSSIADLISEAAPVEERVPDVGTLEFSD